MTALRILLVYALSGLAGFAIYVMAFALPIGGEILFYRGIVLALLTAAAIAAGLFALRWRAGVDLATGIGAVLTGLAFNICFLVLFPVTIDRSISVFLLSRIAAEQPLSTAELEQRFADEYLVAMEQIPRRVHEQALSGNVTVEPNGGIRLTGRGETFVALARAAGGWFHTDPRFVDPAAVNPAAGTPGLGKK